MIYFILLAAKTLVMSLTSVRDALCIEQASYESVHNGRLAADGERVDT